MKVELAGPLNYDKLSQYLESEGRSEEEIKREIDYIKELIKERTASLVATAGTISRYKGNVFENFEEKEQSTKDKNLKTIQNIIGLGHDSITDHKYYIFLVSGVSMLMEQILIDERFSSFTIKSRREVNFSKDGIVLPTFRDKNYNILANNADIREEYNRHSNILFRKYSEFIEKGMKNEDARFILPYSLNSNIVMGFDTHTLKDIIIKFTKTKYRKIKELNELGEKLYEIAQENFSFIIPEIDKVQIDENDDIKSFLSAYIEPEQYKILDSPRLINHSDKIDDMILISCIMRNYQYTLEHAIRVYEEASKMDPNFKINLMRKIAFKGDRKELAQVNFEFQIPLSYAVLTHLTRHRTHPIMVPDFTNIDLTQYKIPPKIEKNTSLLQEYKKIFELNLKEYSKFKQYGICDEDLIYFIIGGNMTNAMTNLDGKTLAHILALRECDKAQWETRQMALGLHREIDKLEDAQIFSKILGPTCVTQHFCKEGKESCGRIKTLKK